MDKRIVSVEQAVLYSMMEQQKMKPLKEANVKMTEQIMTTLYSSQRGMYNRPAKPVYEVRQ